MVRLVWANLTMYSLIPYIYSEGIILLLYFLADVNFDSQRRSIISANAIHDGSIEMSEVNEVNEVNVTIQNDENDEEDERNN